MKRVSSGSLIHALFSIRYNKAVIYPIIAIGILLMLINSCIPEKLPIILPVLTTSGLSSITETTANSGGNIKSDGGGTITAYGVCWSTAIHPTIMLATTTNDGAGKGSFTSSITGLKFGTTYYVRAYAINSAGTAYGNEISFNSNVFMPTLTTTAITSIAATTASSGGNITSDGGGTISARGVCWGTSNNPTIALGTKTSDGTGIGSFTSSVTALAAKTTYYVRAYATNIAGTAYGNEITIITDVEANVYNIVTIGTQVWMKENLKTTKYNDGTAIPNMTDAAAWAALTTPSYCWYNNDAATYKTTYGALYNWYAVDLTSTGGKDISPIGWHVPTDAEWTTLTNYLGGANIAGGKMKETGTTHWTAPNTGATNESGFTCLPCSYRNKLGEYSLGAFLKDGYWWSNTERDLDAAWYNYVHYDNGIITKTALEKKIGFSIRCVKN